MPYLNLKPTHKPVTDYFKALKKVQQLSLLDEGAVAPAFANLLRACASRMNWTLAEQYAIPRKGRRPLRADGAFLDQFKLRHGVWEAKDSKDDLDKEVKKKFSEGYPQDNILFQAPDRAILVQNGRTIFDEPITDPDNLVEVLKLFCEYQPPAFEQWDVAVEEFKERVPELAQSLLELIETERKQNRAFRDAFGSFTNLMRDAINPNLSDKAVEEMLIQHLLTERIFRKVFNNPDVAQRNIIAREIEKVIEALTSRHFSRHDFLRSLDRFYGAIETTAATIEEFSEKQDFLNTVYEKFFQGFSVKVADTHGIVYTPQPIVDFMVRSVDDILRREFGKTDGLASDGVAILDPFVGTGNFILRVLRQMPKSKLPHKYKHEMFCNEVMLLPYYIASMNIEHDYYELTGRYEPFDGISLVDTFELAEGRQMPLFAPENTQRVQRQKNTPIFVIIGNPPYNAGQVNANDNNQNRKYPTIDQRVTESYITDSNASDKSDLIDPYVKAFRWASDRIGDEGVVAFVSNNSFVDGIAFDGMRKHLQLDFDVIYVLNLQGDIRKDSMREGVPLGEKHTVFGLAAMVGVAITFLVRKKPNVKSDKIYYHSVDWKATRAEKFDVLEHANSSKGISWEEIQPNQKNVWLTQEMDAQFDLFIPTGTKDAKTSNISNTQTVFKLFSLGASTNRDAWAYNFDRESVIENMKRTIESYNGEVTRWLHRTTKTIQPNDFLLQDDTKIKWSSSLRSFAKRGLLAEFSSDKVRKSLYRPFTTQYLFFDKVFTHRRAQMQSVFPVFETVNQVICVGGYGRKEFAVLMTDRIPDLNLYADPQQSLPFYTYNKDGRNRRENITDWALEQFRTTYAAAPNRPEGFSPEQTTVTTDKPFGSSPTLTKWHIFHYVYALLHHPTYRETYAANLRRELPRIPFVQPQHFWQFVQAGERLAQIHVHYEAQPEYPLQHIENPDEPLDYRVQKMRLSKDKTSLKYNDFLTLNGIPPQVFAYKLGNRSALDWVIDQYQIKTDKRSGITNDPNNLDDETYILRLIKQVISVSLETVQIVENLPPLEIIEDL